MNNTELTEKIHKLKTERQAVILAHNYQEPAVQDIADFVGDSLELSQKAAKTEARVIVFCGVHFMAETADLLTPEHVSVILPDLSAGCSMADMADYDDALAAWDLIQQSLKDQGWTGRIIPITYINSTAAIKAFVGRHGGIVCTSSNAARRAVGPLSPLRISPPSLAPAQV